MESKKPCGCQVTRILYIRDTDYGDDTRNIYVEDKCNNPHYTIDEQIEQLNKRLAELEKRLGDT